MMYNLWKCQCALEPGADYLLSHALSSRYEHDSSESLEDGADKGVTDDARFTETMTMMRRMTMVMMLIDTEESDDGDDATAHDAHDADGEQMQ